MTKLARFHIEFEGIYSFIDGNGRTGRLQVNLELVKAGFPPSDIKYSDRLVYYETFDDYHLEHDLTSMEKLFAGYLNERLDKYIKILGYELRISLLYLRQLREPRMPLSLVRKNIDEEIINGRLINKSAFHERIYSCKLLIHCNIS